MADHSGPASFIVATVILVVGVVAALVIIATLLYAGQVTIVTPPVIRSTP